MMLAGSALEIVSAYEIAAVTPIFNLPLVYSSLRTANAPDLKFQIWSRDPVHRG